MIDLVLKHYASDNAINNHVKFVFEFQRLLGFESFFISAGLFQTKWNTARKHDAC